MSANSKIEWTHHTFNPWWGCAKVSPGCDHCYAERDAGRYFPTRKLWGVGEHRRTFGDKHWNEPLRWDRAAELAKQRHRVFCASMADVFDKDGPAEHRARLWDLIEATPNLDWLLLTKRVGNVMRMTPDRWSVRLPDNVWLGISVVNQEEADRDIPKLLAVPAKVRFLSVEPMLGPLDLVEALNGYPVQVGSGGPDCEPEWQQTAPPLDWVIAGGESGHHARPMHPDWARSLRDQCAAARVPFLFKQWGEWAPHRARPGGDEGGDLRRGYVRYLQGDGREPDGHFRKGDAAVARVGKKAAGRELDGRTWNEFPRSAT